jgi:endonuclease IV
MPSVHNKHPHAGKDRPAAIDQGTMYMESCSMVQSQYRRRFCPIVNSTAVDNPMI